MTFRNRTQIRACPILLISGHARRLFSAANNPGNEPPTAIENYLNTGLRHDLLEFGQPRSVRRGIDARFLKSNSMTKGVYHGSQPDPLACWCSYQGHHSLVFFSPLNNPDLSMGQHHELNFGLTELICRSSVVLAVPIPATVSFEETTICIVIP
jgi:hypothetical protein